MGETSKGRGEVDEFNADPAVGKVHDFANTQSGAEVGVKPKTLVEIKALAEKSKERAVAKVRESGETPDDPDLAHFLNSDATKDVVVAQPAKNSVPTEATVDPYDDSTNLGPAQAPDIDLILEKRAMEGVSESGGAKALDKKSNPKSREVRLKDLEDDFISALQDRGYKILKLELTEGKNGHYSLLIRFKKDDPKGKGKVIRDFRIAGSTDDLMDTIHGQDLNLPTTKARR